MKEREEKFVAQASEIDVISADSPCQSFSTAIRRNDSSQRLLNMFMIASVLSYVDFYRPQYAFPKNVLDMTKCDVNDKKENVFAQMICGLVDMKRQIRFFCLDA
jgi:DNA (cytosine-5)-methyltransferase 1